MIKSKKAMEFDVIVKAVIALLILAVIAGLLYLFVIKKGAGGANTIVDDTADEGDNVLNDFRNLIGGKCEDGEEKCGMTGQKSICEDGEWVRTDDDCEES